ncbi:MULTISPECIES: helix-turn-helix domain-containing protein [Pseudomonas]|uniref:helix-turn-helix domain-containing protein n=1 Tax=Pseudomonas guariconensis TaxID=1288410 RepID=UPI0020981A5C|nr:MULTISPECIES: XRE family transcriptional regulator [Pseudomonas]MCO7597470.1 XRE family transcriptional regulator [Pseudomonas guariconensis]MCU7223212.1 XRE family transcriptional regulator [Pseudomonas brassicacearum]
MKTIDSTPDTRSSNPGAAIRALRRNANMTLAQLSAKTGMAASTLSKLEAGHISLSFDKLMAISRGLGVDMTELLGSSGQALLPAVAPAPSSLGRRVVQRAGDGQQVETRSYSQRFLATELLHKKMAPMVVEVHARTMEEFFAEFGDFIRHPGEEFVYIIEGEVEFHTDLYAPVRLGAGDTLYFDSEMGHAYLKASDAPCRIVAAAAPRNSIEPVIQTFVSLSEKQAGTAKGRVSGSKVRRSSRTA